ncbi:hypothetical protein [Kitasatospora sp. NPDC005751]|uniref:hypothetical protein n=1 Tax=Kitasatospora sp. NPDC005751 TaxID=3157064 RepID=UPI0033EB1654
MTTGWFACFETDEDTNPRYPWQAALQLDGHMLSAGAWFSTEAECTAFIRAHVIGQSLLDDGPDVRLVEVTTLGDSAPRYVLDQGTHEALVAMGWTPPGLGPHPEPGDPWSISYHRPGASRLNPAVCSCGLPQTAAIHHEPPHRPVSGGFAPEICSLCHHVLSAHCHTQADAEASVDG